MTLEELRVLLEEDIRITHPYVLSVFRTGKMGEGFNMQFGSYIVDTDDPYGPKRWHWGRKHYVSPHACKSEVVNAAFGLYTAFWQHEMREMFRYKDQQIFSPHLDVERLADFIETEPFEFRN